MRIAAHFVADVRDIKGYPPLCFGYLYAYLKKYGPSVEMKVLHSADEIAAYRPDVVAFSATTLDFTLARRLAANVKRRLNVPILVGGVHITVLPQNLYPEFDIGIVGEGEETFRRLMECFERRGGFEADDLKEIEGLVFRADGELVMTGRAEFIEPLDRIPHPDRRLIGQSGEQAYMFTSRGCPYRCSFCSSQVHWGKYRTFSPEYVVEEIEELYYDFGVRKIHFYDDLFVADVNRLERIAELIEARGFAGKIEFSCAIRANLATERLMEVLKRMGIRRVTFGAESNSATVLKYLKGGNVSPENNQRAVDLCHRFGIKLSPSFIRGAPVETGDDLMETYRFLIKNIRDKKIDYFEFHNLTPFPGTQVWEEAKEMGLVSDDMDDWGKLRYPSEFFYMNRNMPKTSFYFFEDLSAKARGMLGIFGRRLVAVVDMHGTGPDALSHMRRLAESGFFDVLLAFDLENLAGPAAHEEELEELGYLLTDPRGMFDAIGGIRDADIFCFVRPIQPFDMEAVKSLVWHHFESGADLTMFAPYKFFYPPSAFERELYVMGAKAFETVAKRYIDDLAAGRALVPAERIVEKWGKVELYRPELDPFYGAHETQRLFVKLLWDKFGLTGLKGRKLTRRLLIIDDRILEKAEQLPKIEKRVRKLLESPSYQRMREAVRRKGVPGWLLKLAKRLVYRE